MEKFDNSVSQEWLMTAMLNLITCIRMGQEYKPHDENNIAVQSVYVADSLIGSFQERFVTEDDTESGGSAGAAVVKQSVASVSNAVHKALTAQDTIHNLSARIMDSAKDFEPAAWALQEERGNSAAPRKTSLRR